MVIEAITTGCRSIAGCRSSHQSPKTVCPIGSFCAVAGASRYPAYRAGIANPTRLTGTPVSRSRTGTSRIFVFLPESMRRYAAPLRSCMIRPGSGDSGHRTSYDHAQRGDSSHSTACIRSGSCRPRRNGFAASIQVFRLPPSLSRMFRHWSLRGVAASFGRRSTYPDICSPL
jgi:hypothetical protein